MTPGCPVAEETTKGVFEVSKAEYKRLQNCVAIIEKGLAQPGSSDDLLHSPNRSNQRPKPPRTSVASPK
jgi:hypothetical protein